MSAVEKSWEKEGAIIDLVGDFISTLPYSV